jgi:hypothetical protein
MVYDPTARCGMKLNFPLETPVSEVVQGQWRPFGVGMDVHEEMVWACVLQPDFLTGKVKRETAKNSGESW